ncbi:MAG: 2-amino-4-hydroxy-6-hydroxymethyldihydropteridine diphosphokinase [Spirochaetes bacterium GWB1_36_13]|nr:MAG: 2-amino-4-hydroxy-6-hydroxymethyldihydropteridine diphosphokinase [Spirochaetes bacterium GWB1_36_13]
MDKKVFLGLGSNSGKKIENIDKACLLLGNFFKVESKSSYYQTEPIGMTEQDSFINMVLSGTTDQEPFLLLKSLKKLEVEMGRKETYRWGPRMIDLDILFYSSMNFSDKILTLPHPEVLNRRFVLEPLFEIAGNLQIGEKKSLFYYLNHTLEQACEKIS